MDKSAYTTKKDWREGVIARVDQLGGDVATVTVAPVKLRTGAIALFTKVFVVEVVILSFFLAFTVRGLRVAQPLKVNQVAFESRFKERCVSTTLSKTNLLSLPAQEVIGSGVTPERKEESDEVNCKSTGIHGVPWVNYLILAPPPSGVPSFIRLLRSISSDKETTRVCSVRVCVAFGGRSDEPSITEAVRRWSKESKVPVYFIPTYSKSLWMRLHESVIWVAQFWKRDILFVADTDVVVPHGFTDIIRENTELGKSIFVPKALNSKTKDWASQETYLSKNFGVYVSDAVDMNLYSSEFKAPTSFMSLSGRFLLRSPKVYGFVEDKLG